MTRNSLAYNFYSIYSPEEMAIDGDEIAQATAIDGDEIAKATAIDTTTAIDARRES